MKFVLNKIASFFLVYFLTISCQQRNADWVVFNANVYTVNDTFEKATAFATSLASPKRFAGTVWSID